MFDIIESLKDIKSFGGKSLGKNIEEVSNKLIEFQETKKSFGRSGTQFRWAHIVMGEVDNLLNYRELTAQIIDKEEALAQAKFNILKAHTRIKIKEEEMESSTSKGKADLLYIEIEEIKHEMKSSEKYIAGCLKDLLTLLKFDEQYKKKYGVIDEEVLAKVEHLSHIKKSIHNAIQDMRAVGRIDKGAQIYLEQVGLNVSWVKSQIVSYLDQEKDFGFSNSILFDFLDQIAEATKECCSIKTRKLGIDNTLMTECLYKN